MHFHFYQPVLLAVLPLFLVPKINAQNTRDEHQNAFRIKIARAASPIKTDGDLSESDWQTAEVATGFWLKWPIDGRQGDVKTEVRLTYDDKFLHIAAICFDTGAYIVQSLKRDAAYWDSDGFAVVLDPTNRATNGYFFGTSAAGVQSEGLVVGNNSDDDDFTWDNRWYVETKRHADRWTAEIAIPFQIIRFNAGQTEWGINFIRNDISNGYWHTWTNMPLQFNGTDLGWVGKLVWDAAPRRSKGNYNVSPYLTSGASRDFENGEPTDFEADAGLDAKIGIGSGMNLDLTANPDFSQIEVDEQVINLTRFDVQLPEKRTFFLENADIFANYGIPPIRPFFSRRIGLDGDGNQIPIIGGARLTGNLDGNTRIGVLNMQTAVARDKTPAQNFTALSVNRRIFGRTILGGYFLNRQAFEKSEALRDNYGRNAGIDFGFTSLDGSWQSWTSWHHSFQPEAKGKSLWGNAGFARSTRRFSFLLDFLTMGENYRADMGFEARIENYDVKRDTTYRIGYRFIFSESSVKFFPKKESKWLNFSELSHENFSVVNPDGSWNEQNNSLNYELNFKNQSGLEIGLSRTWANVPVHFKFDDEEDLSRCPPLPPGEYSFVSAGIEYGSDWRKAFSYRLEGKAGQFYNGKQWSASAEASLRVQPWGNFRLKAEYNLLDFPAPYCDAALFAVTPRIEIFFNRNLNWTTFLQFNNQADNFNINSRLQWRYRPMSDLFLVYTDNYVASTGFVKNRALVLKANYWL